MDFPHPMNSRLLALLSRHAAALGDEGFEIYDALATGKVEIVPRTIEDEPEAV